MKTTYLILLISTNFIFAQNLLGSKFVDYSNTHSIDEDGNTIAAINKIPNTNQNIEVFDFVNDEWQQRASNPGFVGSQVQLSGDGNTLIIGAPSLSPPERVSIFHWDGTSWNQRGNDFTSNTASTTFGTRVYINNDGSKIFFRGTQGEYFNYHWDGNTWVLIDTLNNLGPNEISINSTGTRLAYTENNSTSSSIANYNIKILELDDNNNWLQIGNDINNPLLLFSSNVLVALDFNSDGNRLAIASAFSFEFNSSAGAFVAYEFVNGQWNQYADIITGDSENQFLGADIALNANGNKIIAGIPSSNAFGQGSGESKLYEFDTSTDSWNEILAVNGELAGSQSGSIVDINGSGDIFSIGADGILPQVRVFGDNILSTNTNTSSTFKLYPNPSQGEVFLDINQESQLQVFDLNGRLLKNNQTLNPGKNIVNLEGLESGFYFIKVYNANEQEVKKLMVL